jgi:hypothetical protein
MGGIVILSGLGYCGYRYATVGSRVRAACSEFASGMTMSQVKAIASSKGLDTLSGVSNVSFVVAPETMGELGCRLTWKSDLVASSQYEGPADDP